MIYKALNEEIIIQEETFPLLEETVSKMTFTPKDKVSKDFPETVSKIMEKLENELGRNVGAGAMDATFGKLKISLSNAKKRILDKDPKNSYPVIIPCKVTENSKVSDAIEKVIKSSGFVKGGRLVTGWHGYYYKNGKDNSIYVCGWYPAAKQIQLQIISVENTKDNMNFIKANHDGSTKNESSIFSNINLI